MKPQELISTIDAEINIHLRRMENVDLEKVVDSYNLDEQQKPIVREYVGDVCTLYNKTVNSEIDDPQETGNSIGCLGAIAGMGIGGVVGSVIGYVVDGPNSAQNYGATGIMIGFLGEMMLRPIANVIANRYIRSIFQSCEQPRNVYRKKAILKLEELSV